ncbi:MAG: ABC transporter substrate-binding protein [Candidatus Carbobacillus altaicus]|nr:ABC transporter substrate-binding protein [Candidatus Carbobacillus altaicus]
MSRRFTVHYHKIGLHRFMSLLLVMSLLGLLAACGGTTQPSSQPQNENQNNDALQETTSSSNSPASSSESTAKGNGTAILTSLDGPVEITFWHAMSGHHEETLQKITDAFMKANEQIKIKLEFQGNYSDLQQKLLAAAKSKTLPTMSQVIETWVTDYKQNHLVMDMNPYIMHPEIGWTKEELDDIVEAFRRANQWDGHYFSLPFSKSAQILFYNTDYLKEKNVDVPQTWEALKDAATELTFEKNGKKVIGFGLENSVGWQFHQWIRQAGGTFIDEETGKVEFDSPEGQEALQFFTGLVKNGIARLAGEDGYMSNPFGRGDVAMFVGSSAGIPFVDSAAKGNIKWSAAPVFAGKEKAVQFAGNAVSIFDAATDEQKLAAWLFIKYLLNTDNTALWAKETGYLPIRYSALKSPIWKDYVQAHPEQGIGTEAFNNGFFDPRVPGFDAVYQIMQKEIEAAFLSEKDIAQALHDAAKDSQEAIDKAKAKAH